MNVLIVYYADGTTARFEDVGANLGEQFHQAVTTYTATHITFTHAGGVEKLALRGVMRWEVVETEEEE